MIYNEMTQSNCLVSFKFIMKIVSLQSMTLKNICLNFPLAHLCYLVLLSDTQSNYMRKCPRDIEYHIFSYPIKISSLLVIATVCNVSICENS